MVKEQDKNSAKRQEKAGKGRKSKEKQSVQRVLAKSGILRRMAVAVSG